MVYNFDLSSKVILITGGYGYLGKAITESLLHHKAKVYVLGRNVDKYNETFRHFSHNNLNFMCCDVSSSESIMDSFERIYRTENQIDVLINNAFYSSGQSPEEMTDEDWTKGVDGTLNSVFRCIKAVIPYLKKQEDGTIINVSSMYGVVAPQFEVYEDYPNFLNPPHYGASKAGIIQLTKYYSSYLGSNNIRVNSVSPGAFPSKEVQKEQGFVNELSKRTNLNRIGQPEDLAGVFTFLSSEAAKYITGQNIVVDGGWTSK